MRNFFTAPDLFSRPSPPDLKMLTGSLLSPSARSKISEIYNERFTKLCVDQYNQNWSRQDHELSPQNLISSRLFQVWNKLVNLAKFLKLFTKHIEHFCDTHTDRQWWRQEFSLGGHGPGWLGDGVSQWGPEP